MKVLLAGAYGQLGTALRRSAPSAMTLVALGRADLDIANESQVHETLARHAPDLVINAAAYTQVDQAESEQAPAFSVNAVGPRVLAEAAAKLGSRLVHISTDFVFSGERPIPYAITDAAEPATVYGRSKLAGEQAVVSTLHSRAVVIRTSWLYAAEGSNFVNTMLRLMGTRDSLGVVSDQIGTPTWSASLAEAVWEVARRPDVNGIQHWSDEGVASWYDFAVAIQEEALERGLLGRSIPVHAIRTADYPTAARRPRYSVLDKRATTQVLGRSSPHWRVNLRAMLDQRGHA
jgi:dTDP-4-dehydrorhamnose reductase